jgi:hypothetical protein
MNMAFSGVAGSRPARWYRLADGDAKSTIKGSKPVIAGLDPAIHLLWKILAKMHGCAGQARA